MKYFLYVQTTDMRKGFRGLSGLVRNELERDPTDGSVYIFINRRRDKIKLLVWDRTGFVLYYKSLESGTFEFPKDHGLVISWDILWMILEGISLDSARQRKRYKRM
jgi:transposase